MPYSYFQIKSSTSSRHRTWNVVNSIFKRDGNRQMKQKKKKNAGAFLGQEKKMPDFMRLPRLRGFDSGRQRCHVESPFCILPQTHIVARRGSNAAGDHSLRTWSAAK